MTGERVGLSQIRRHADQELNSAAAAEQQRHRARSRRVADGPVDAPAARRAERLINGVPASQYNAEREAAHARSGHRGQGASRRPSGETTREPRRPAPPKVELDRRRAEQAQKKAAPIHWLATPVPLHVDSRTLVCGVAGDADPSLIAQYVGAGR
jgi:hypothetical protein